MFRFLTIATLLCVGSCDRNAGARVDCSLWNSSVFFATATAADVRRCLAAGAEVNARDTFGQTPLHLAAKKGNAETVTALVKAGADIEVREEKYGLTPL
ncbi:MAG: ankyrin repeat domain-containing protein, partial [Hyphomonadaceae bacterium]|nr:ankyrin repeat domain-containing protein [Hyphomonadaceae bacterium]